MKSNTLFVNFVQESIHHIKGFDSTNSEDIKEVIRLAINHYGFKTEEKVETTEVGKIEVIHLASIVEENMLSKIAELACGHEEETSIEVIYKGYVVRNY